MKSIVLGCLIMLAPVHLFAQEVIGSQGDFSSASQGSLSWTVGEIVTETFTSINGTFTQGFQQLILSDASLSELAGSFQLEVYPNPFHTTISILGLGITGEYQVTVIDVSGKTIHRSVIDIPSATQLYQLDLSHLASGTYHLHLSSDQSTISINRIVKY